MTKPRQATIAAEVEAEGVALHSGARVHLWLKPAPADTGILFARRDLTGTPVVPARPDAVDRLALQRRTELVGADGARVATPEHLLAACLGLGVDNLRIELDGPEVPIFDGSVRPFVELIERAGLKTLKAARRYWNLKRPVTLADGDREIVAVPARSMQLAFFCELKQAGIENQAAEWEVGGDAAAFRELSAARTWVAYEDVERLRQAGLIRGGSLANAIVLRDGRPVAPEGTERRDYRLPNELACHKLLDLIGDLALLGRPVGALITARGSGHAMHQAFVEKLGKEIE
jgi:UDP-3-O-[3-hydroxymyristoyl] N-acetylglucosamine deacetylase